MNYNELVVALKKGQEETGALEITQRMLLNLTYIMRDAHPEGPIHKELDEMISALNTNMHLMAYNKHCVMRYFSAEGPIANKLRDYDSINRYFNNCDGNLTNPPLRFLLEKFDFKPRYSEEETIEFRNWLRKISEKTLGPQVYNFDIQIPYQTDRDVEVEMTTGFYDRVKNDGTEPTMRLMVLSRDFESGMKIRFIAHADGNMQLLYYHPGELIWICDDGNAVIEGVQEALKEEYVRFCEETKQAAANFDVNDIALEIAQKAYFIFDHEDKLPQVVPPFVRKNPAESYIAFEIENYQWIFSNTKGAYPSRSEILTMTMGAFGSRLTIDQVREGPQRELIKYAKAHLDRIIGTFLRDEVNKHVETLLTNPEPLVDPVALIAADSPHIPGWLGMLVKTFSKG